MGCEGVLEEVQGWDLEEGDHIGGIAVLES